MSADSLDQFAEYIIFGEIFPEVQKIAKRRNFDFKAKRKICEISNLTADDLKSFIDQIVKIVNIIKKKIQNENR